MDNLVEKYQNIEENTIPKITVEDLKFLQDQYGVAKDAKKKGLPYANWLLRAMDPNMQTILIDGKQASHLLSYGEIDGKIILYPEIQQMGKNLVHVSSTPWANGSAILNAYKNGNYIEVPDEETAQRISQTYKQYGRGFRQFDIVPNQQDSFIIQNTTNRQQIAKDFLNNKEITFNGISYKLNPQQISAILGNYLVESGLDENKQEISDGGFGLAQWTNQIRKTNLNNHLPNVNTEFERQLSYTLEELENPDMWYDKTAAEKFFNAQTVEEATKYFMNGFEAPKKSKSHESRRQDAAKYFFENYQQGTELPSYLEYFNYGKQ